MSSLCWKSSQSKRRTLHPKPRAATNQETLRTQSSSQLPEIQNASIMGLPISCIRQVSWLSREKLSAQGASTLSPMQPRVLLTSSIVPKEPTSHSILRAERAEDPTEIHRAKTRLKFNNPRTLKRCSPPPTRSAQSFSRSKTKSQRKIWNFVSVTR